MVGLYFVPSPFRRECNRSSTQWRHYRVGVTRGGNWRCHPYFFLEKLTFLVITVCQFCSVTPICFPKNRTTFFAHHCHFYSFHSGVTPAGYHVAPFYLSDLVSPLFFVNSATIFFLRVSPPGGCHPGRSPQWRHCLHLKTKLHSPLLNELKMFSACKSVVLQVIVYMFIRADLRDPSVSWHVTRMTRDPWPSQRPWHESITTIYESYDEFTTIDGCYNNVMSDWVLLSK